MRPSSPSQPHPDRLLALSVALFVLAVYLSTTALSFHMIDEVAAFSVSRSLAGRGTLDSDVIYWTYAPLGRGSITGQGIDGHWYATKDFTPLLLATPLIWLAKLIETSPVRASMLLMSFATAAATGGLVLVVRALGYRRFTAVLGGLTYGLASLAWPYALLLFTQPMAALGLVIALYGSIRAHESGDLRAALWGGLGLGLAGTSSAATWVASPLYLLYLIPWKSIRSETRIIDLWTKTRLPAILAAGAGIFAAAQGAYNLLRFGSPLLTGHQQFGGANFKLYYFGLGSYGQLFSTPRGVIWYAPVVLLIPFGLWYGLRAGGAIRRAMLLALGLAVMVFSAYSTYFTWWAGHTWGPRYLVPVMPMLTLLVVPVLDRLVQPAPIWARLLVGLLWLISFTTQLVATLFNYLFTEVDISYGLHLITPPASFIVRAPILTDPNALPFVRQVAAARAHQWDVLWMSRGSLDGLLLAVQVIVIALAAVWLLMSLRRSEARVVQIGLLAQAVVTGGLIVFMLLRYPQGPDEVPGMDALIDALEPQVKSGDGVVAILPYSQFDWLDSYDASAHDMGLVFENPLSEATTRLLTHAERWHERLWIVTEGTTRGDPVNAAELWLSEHGYAGIETWVEGFRYVPYTFAPDGLEVNAPGFERRWADGIGLAGYGIQWIDRPDGGWINVKLVWNAQTQPEADYTVFIHLLDASGVLVAQHDGPPQAGYALTSTWQPGVSISDQRSVAIPAVLHSGEYSLWVGLYDPATGERLKRSDGSDALLLEVIQRPEVSTDSEPTTLER